MSVPCFQVMTFTALLPLRRQQQLLLQRLIPIRRQRLRTQQPAATTTTTTTATTTTTMQLLLLLPLQHHPQLQLQLLKLLFSTTARFAHEQLHYSNGKGNLQRPSGSVVLFLTLLIMCHLTLVSHIPYKNPKSFFPCQVTHVRTHRGDHSHGV